jgi:tRNA (mo5U34)-methyltransferase
MKILRRFSPKSPELTCAMTSASVLRVDENRRLHQSIKELNPWFHNYEIAKGVWTNPDGVSPGPDYPARRWTQVAPWFSDIAGKSLLDVGCSSGFFSLKAAEMGASVVGVDSGEQPLALDQARLAQATLHLGAEFQGVSVYDLPQLGRTFDIVLFMGVFYHLRHPLLALEALRKVCHGTMIFQTITTPSRERIQERAGVSQDVRFNSPDMLDGRFPAMKFVEGSLAGDVTCWFIPNVEGVAAVLRSSGFDPKDFIFPNVQEVFVRCTVK